MNKNALIPTYDHGISRDEYEEMLGNQGWSGFTIHHCPTYAAAEKLDADEQVGAPLGSAASDKGGFWVSRHGVSQGSKVK